MLLLVPTERRKAHQIWPRGSNAVTRRWHATSTLLRYLSLSFSLVCGLSIGELEILLRRDTFLEAGDGKKEISAGAVAQLNMIITIVYFYKPSACSIVSMDFTSVQNNGMNKAMVFLCLGLLDWTR